MAGVTKNHGQERSIGPDSPQDWHIMVNRPLQGQSPAQVGDFFLRVRATVHGEIATSGSPGKRDVLDMSERPINGLDDRRVEEPGVLDDPTVLLGVDLEHREQVGAGDRPTMGVRAREHNTVVRQPMPRLECIASPVREIAIDPANVERHQDPALAGWVLQYKSLGPEVMNGPLRGFGPRRIAGHPLTGIQRMLDCQIGGDRPFFGSDPATPGSEKRSII